MLLYRNYSVLRNRGGLHQWNVYGGGCLASGARATSGNCWFSGWMVLGDGSSQRAGFMEQVSPFGGLWLR